MFFFFGVLFSVVFDKNELRKLSKRELVSIILYQEERLAKVEHYLKAFNNAHTPSSKQLKINTKEQDNQVNGKPRFPGKPMGGNGGGIELPAPDKIVEHLLEFDPKTSQRLGNPIGYRVKTVIDFPEKPIEVIEHHIMQYLSSSGLIIEPAVDLPTGIYGKNIQSITALLKSLVNSHEKVAEFMQELGAPSFSAATVQNICDNYSNKFAPTRQALLSELQKKPVVGADETLFRKDGQNGYVWGVFTDKIAIFEAADGRNRENIERLLPNFGGVIVTDGYGAYKIFARRQRCWAHQLRELKTLAKEVPDTRPQYERATKLYEQLKLLKEKPPNEEQIQNAKEELSNIASCLQTIKGAEKTATLIQNGGDDWFTALYYPGVPLDNNFSERGLRELVLLRKNIGCYRNNKGKKWIENTLSVLQTWKLQNKNRYQELQKIAS